MDERCPACASTNILGKKFGMGDCSIIERGCLDCGLAEWRNDRDADYDQWDRRWSGKRPARSGPPRKQQSKPSRAPRREPARPPVPPAPPDPRVGRSCRDPDVTLASLFAAIVADPGADAPRFAYADALEGRMPLRAALIRHAIHSYRVCRGEEELDVSYSASWARSRLVAEGEALRDGWGDYVLPHVRPRGGGFVGHTLERGFVGYLRTDAAVVVDEQLGLFDLTPLEHLSLAPGGPMRQALASPRLAQLRSLHVLGAELDDDDAVILAREGHLKNCRWLDLQSNRIGPRGVEALLASPTIRAIPVVRLDYNPCDPAQQYSYDCHGTIADTWLPDEGKRAEAAYGRIRWLHLSGRGLADFRYPEHAHYYDFDL